MKEFICNHCTSYINENKNSCPHCGSLFIFSGEEKNITDALQPDCLVYRYDGSDLLEKAVVLKPGKVNVKTAIQLKDVAKPITIAKNRVYAYNPEIFAAIAQLREERREAMQHYDYLIGEYWKALTPYSF